MHLFFLRFQSTANLQHIHIIIMTVSGIRRKIQILINDIFHRPPFRADITTDTPRAADILCPCTRKSPSAHINGNMVTRHFIKSTANLRISFFLIQTQLLRSTDMWKKLYLKVKKVRKN